MAAQVTVEPTTTRPMNTPLILVAGGESSRMGHPKGLLDCHGKLWLEEQIDRFGRCGGLEAVLVLGFQAAEYFKALPWLEKAFFGSEGRSGVEVVPTLNQFPKHGPFSSILAGIRALTVKDFGAYLLPIDVPVPSPEVFRAMEEARRPGIQAQIPAYGGRGGHPVWISREFMERLWKVRMSSRLARLDRQISLLSQGSIQKIEVEDRSVLYNFNTPQEFREYLDGLSPA